MTQESKLQIYDSLFTHLLSNKEYALKAYQAINPDDHTVTEDDIEDITINNVFVNGIYNDFSMRVKNQELIFFEAQSYSLTNITFRILCYYVESEKANLEKKKKLLYTSKALPLVKPRFYVVYSGDDNPPDTLYFNETYFDEENIDLNVTVHVIKDTNTEVNRTIFDEYLFFCRRFKINRKLYGNTKKAVEVSFNECTKANVLKDYIENHREELIDIMDILFNHERNLELYGEELKEEAYKEGKEQGITQGIDIGKLNEKKQIAKKMKDKGMDIEDIMEMTDLSKEEIEQL